MNIPAISPQAYPEAKISFQEASKAVDGQFSFSYQADASIQLISEDKQYELLLQATVEVNIQAKMPANEGAIKSEHPEFKIPEIDVSPEATAQRIVDMATAAFGRFQAKHNDLSGQEALASFMETIKSGLVA